MSRSRRKYASLPYCCVGRKGMRLAKRKSNRKVRRQKIEELGNGNHYRRVDDRYGWPDDGRRLSTETKYLRK